LYLVGRFVGIYTHFKFYEWIVSGCYFIIASLIITHTSSYIVRKLILLQSMKLKVLATIKEKTKTITMIKDMQYAW